MTITTSIRRLALIALGLMPLGSPLIAADPANDLTITGDALTLNLGAHTCSDDSLRALTHFAIAGTFFSNDYVSPKFPAGGALHLGTRQPGKPTARLNPNAVITLAGGYLHLIGQGLDGDPAHPGDTDTVEHIRQLRLVSGMSALRIENGNDVSRSTTLQMDDPTAGIVRQRGATLVLSGDERRSKAGANSPSGPQAAFSAAIGPVERLRVASGMTAFLRGEGAAGSPTCGVIPWITVGSFLQPGMGGVATWDPVVGVRALTANEYDKKLKGRPGRNVWTDNLELGENQKQSVNALVFVPYFSSQIGAGSTLTITSGFLQFGQRGPSTIGSHPQGGDYVSTGTIDFGAAEGVIWTCFEPEWGPNIIGPVIAGSGGLTVAGSNTLILHGASTYTGTTCIADGVLQVGDVFPTSARLGVGDVEIAAGALLRLKATVRDAIADNATVTLRTAGSAFAGVLDLERGIDETVGGLVLDGKPQEPGTYGSTASTATHKLDHFFTGAGVLTVRSRVSKQ